MGFGGCGAGCRVLAEAVRVHEVITSVGGVGAREALDAAVRDLYGGDGEGLEGEEYEGDGDDDGGDDGRHCELCWMDGWICLDVSFR